MTLSIKIGIGADELPSDGEICSCCEVLIIGTVYYPYVFAGLEQYGKHLGPLCEPCYKEIFKGEK